MKEAQRALEPAATAGSVVPAMHPLRSSAASVALASSLARRLGNKLHPKENQVDDGASPCCRHRVGISARRIDNGKEGVGRTQHRAIRCVRHAPEASTGRSPPVKKPSSRPGIAAVDHGPGGYGTGTSP
jgi:hypothetical protein